MDTPSVKSTFKIIMNVNQGLMGVASGIPVKGSADN